MSTFVRWGKFNLVGAMGMVVQLGALAWLNVSWPGHYLAATAAALELTLVHNFIWHLHYTWRDRFSTPIAQLRRERRDFREDTDSALRIEHPGARSVLMGQLVRFHLSNGLVSIVGNLALMPLLVHRTRIPVVAANAIAILCCSLVNFCLGNSWAFAARTQMQQRSQDLLPLTASSCLGKSRTN